jgi:hypothetical protein
MPARKDYTPEELGARLERRREQVRAAVRRYRERRKAVSDTPETAVTLTYKEVSPTPPAPDPTLPESSTNSPPPPARRLEALLVPLEARGYRHDPAFLDRLAQKYPEVDLELEVAAAVDWLYQPRNAKRPCSKGFLKNWVMKAETDRVQRAAAPPARPPNGNGPYAPPAAFQRNLERTYKAPEDFSPDELARSDAARERVKERLPANLRGRWHR